LNFLNYRFTFYTTDLLVNILNAGEIIQQVVLLLLNKALIGMCKIHSIGPWHRPVPVLSLFKNINHNAQRRTEQSRIFKRWMQLFIHKLLKWS